MADWRENSTYWTLQTATSKGLGGEETEFVRSSSEFRVAANFREVDSTKPLARTTIHDLGSTVPFLPLSHTTTKKTFEYVL